MIAASSVLSPALHVESAMFDGSFAYRFRALVLVSLLAASVMSICGAAPGACIADEAPDDSKPRNAAAPFPVFPADPQALLDSIFGPSADVDEALATVEISLEEERKFGKQAFDAYLADLKRRNIRVTTRGSDADYLRRIVAAIRPCMQHAERYKSITIYVADSQETDARSFPGGTLLFYRGLLDYVESEAALAGIVGHELSHLDRGHQLTDLKRMALAERAFSGRGGEPFSPERMLLAGRAMSETFARPFRPEDEAEADRDGAEWAYRSGYDPREMAKVFARLHERDKDKPAAALPQFLRTHPVHADRSQAIREAYEQLQRHEARDDLYVGRENLKRRLTKEQRRFDE